MQGTAIAQPNIALIKYWGKRNIERNLPAVGSISITLRDLHTRMSVEFDDTLVADTLTPRDDAEHTYQARWHLMTTAAEFDESTSIVTTTDTGLPNLALVPLITEGLTVSMVSAQTEPEILGWWVQRGRDHKPATTVMHNRSGTGAQHLLTLLLPIQAGSDNPLQEVSSTGPGKYEVLLTDGRKITLSVDPDPRGGIEIY